MLIFLPGIKRNLEQDFRIITLQPIIQKSGDTSKVQTIIGAITTIKEIHKIKRDYPEINININFKDFLQIKKNRNDALINSILFNPKQVNGSILFNGKKYKAKIRLKGDLEAHWSFNKQWSLRIELSNGETILGMNEFSISQHQARNFPYTQIISKSLKLQKVKHVADYISLKVKINGENWGIMLAEEQYSNAYLEKRQKVNSPIIKISNEENWKFYKQIEELNNNKNKGFDLKEAKNISKFQGIFEIDTFNAKKYHSIIYNDRLSKFKNLNEAIVLKKINSKNIGSYLNLDILAKVIASSFIWGDSHSLNTNNMRFYINPFDSKLEAIPTDHSYMFGNLNNFIKNFDIKAYEVVYYYLPEIIKIALENKKFQSNYYKEILAFQYNLHKLKTEFEKICESGLSICSAQVNFELLNRNIDKMKFYEKNIFELIKKNYKIKTKSYKNSTKIIANKYDYLDYLRNHIHVRVFNSGKLIIKNISPYNLHISNVIHLKNKNCNFNQIQDVGFDKDCIIKLDHVNKLIEQSIYPNLNEIIFYSDKLILGEKIIIEYIINKKKFFKEITVENKIYDESFTNKNQNKNFIKIEKKKDKFVIKPGVWEVFEPIIIPENYNLDILPGTKIFFHENTFIKLEKGSINLLGEKKDPIVLLAKNKFWKGILILNSNELSKTSYIKNTEFINLAQYSDAQTHLTGSINFYNSNVEIIDSKFTDNFSEDFLNIVNSEFVINDCYFENIHSDAIDIDYGKGNLINTEFYNVKGDAFDTSGSNTIITNNNFSDILDKAISVGENSKTIISNNKITNTSIGIAIKDGSSASINDLIIKRSLISDVMVYRKKTFYEMSEVNFIDSIEGLNVKIQDGNYGLSMGKKIKTTEIDIDKLYNR